MASGGTRLPGYAAAGWGLLFAVPSFAWALGSDFGASTTVAPSLLKLAHDRVPWFVAVLWVTVFLKILGAAIGVGLTVPFGTTMGRSLVCCGWGAAVLLVWHGVLFIIQGILVETGTLTIDPMVRGVIRWYLYLWGPWFVLGGLTFAAAAWMRTRVSLDQRGERVAGLIGAAGGIGLSVTAFVAGIG
jgi:hypothetical protein